MSVASCEPFCESNPVLILVKDEEQPTELLTAIEVKLAHARAVLGEL